MIAYLRSKRQLIARNHELAAIVAKQVDELIEKNEQLAEYDRALTALRDSFDRTRISRELAAEFRGGATSPPRPRFDRTAARLRQQGVPADLVEAIDEETAMKRRLDGAGDPA